MSNTPVAMSRGFQQPQQHSTAQYTSPITQPQNLPNNHEAQQIAHAPDSTPLSCPSTAMKSPALGSKNGTVLPSSVPQTQAPPPAPQRTQQLPPSQQYAPTNHQQVTSDDVPIQPPQNQAGTPQYEEVANMIKSTSPQVLRQVMRDHWERCFLGSDYHVAFVLNATLHQAPAALLGQAIKDFGAKMVQGAMPQIIEHCSAEDIDRVADLVLSKVSKPFLDRALARRLETIDARSLVNALARAERLGYDIADIVEERAGNHPEHVIPSLKGIHSTEFNPNPQVSNQNGQLPMHHSGEAKSYSTSQQHPEPPKPQAQTWRQHRNWMTGLLPVADKGPGSIRHCGECRRPCSGSDALDYHLKKGACDPDFSLEKVGKTICVHCGCAFGSNGGIVYHEKSAVCGDYSTETRNMVLEALQLYDELRRMRSSTTKHSTTTTFTPEKHSTPRSEPPKQNTPQTGTSTLNPDSSNPLVHLTLETRKRYEDDIRQAELKYGALMREAMEKSEPEKSDLLSRLKNSFNTKQSTTRKRYGIRIGKRTQEEIDGERRRLLGDDGPEQWADSASVKKPRLDIWTPVAAMTPRARPSLSQPSQFNHADSPRKRVPLSKMGGLSGSVGSAELTDPTAFLTTSQSRGLVPGHTQASSVSKETTGDSMSIDGDNDNQARDQDDSTDSEDSSDSDDDDIPA